MGEAPVQGVMQAVQEALKTYGQTHSMGPQDVKEASLDFLRFYLAALRLGLKGIRWNFNGCILCDSHPVPTPLCRILLLHPRVTEAAGGRGFGTVACMRHVHLIEGHDERSVEAALRRIRKEPPQQARGAA